MELESLWKYGLPPLDEQAMARARRRWAELTKPLGSLGLLEDVAARLSAMTGHTIPRFNHPHAIVFSGDHGVSAEGVSAYGAEVTEEMAVNIQMGGAVSSVLARNLGVSLSVVDVGVRTVVRHPGVTVSKVAPGTRNFRKGPAMTESEMQSAFSAGADAVDEKIRQGMDLLLAGELGIANTSAASAIAAVLLPLSVEDAVGRGTGIDDAAWMTKCAVVRDAIAVNRPRRERPLEVLQALGGFEIAALVGALLAAARRRVPVVLDGMVTGAAALVATALCPELAGYLVAGHRSPEPAHGHILKALGLVPLMALGLRLGEASGALLAWPVIRGACQVMEQAATFGDARVTSPHCLPPLPDSVGGAPPSASDFTAEERAVVYKVISARRDIRSFLPDPIPDAVLQRILAAAHHGPSVGFMQPWNFIVIRDSEVLGGLAAIAEKERVRAAQNYGEGRRGFYLRLKVEGLREAPVTIGVTNDSRRGGPHVLGRNTIPETDLMSTACAIENLWLAARSEGVGLGWVSFYEKQAVRALLGIPDGVDPVALLSLGYTAYFPEVPLLQRIGWAKRLALGGLVFQDRWGNPAWPHNEPEDGREQDEDLHPRGR